MNWLAKIFGSTAQRKQNASSTSPHVEALKVSSYLSESAIAFFPAGPSKQQILGKLIGSLDLGDPNLALKAILAREDAGGTVIAPGIALPHARVPGVTTIKAALGISPSGVVEARLSTPISIFFLFLAPSDNMKEHLAFLAAVSSLLHSKGTVSALSTAENPRAALEIIRQAERL